MVGDRLKHDAMAQAMEFYEVSCMPALKHISDHLEILVSASIAFL